MFNDAAFPESMVKYTYRELFGLSAQEMADEPMDQFLINLHIYGQIQKKRNSVAKHHG